jgi:hypothetical protein
MSAAAQGDAGESGGERVLLHGEVERVRRRPSVLAAPAPAPGSGSGSPALPAPAPAPPGGWVEDDSVTGCMVCAAPFSLLRRRHHCRACGNVVCHSCSPNTAPIAELPDAGRLRVCTQCYWGQAAVRMLEGPAAAPRPVQAGAASKLFPSFREADAPAPAPTPASKKAASPAPPPAASREEARPRRGSDASTASSVSNGSRADGAQGHLLMADGAAQALAMNAAGGAALFPTPLFAAKLKRPDGSKVFVNIGTSEALLPGETIVGRHQAGGAACFDYTVHPARATAYLLLLPEEGQAQGADLTSKEALSAKGKLVAAAVELISLKYGSLSLAGLAPTYPETKNNHKGPIMPFERSPSQQPQPAPDALAARPGSWGGGLEESDSAVFDSDLAQDMDPPALRKGWLTVLGTGGRGLVGMGSKKRFVVLDAGLLSVYKLESDTPPYGHRRKSSMLLDGAAILADETQTRVDALSQRRGSSASSSVDTLDAQRHAGAGGAQARRRSSVFGAGREAESRRIFVASAHGTRVGLECEGAEGRLQWARALNSHADYASFVAARPPLSLSASLLQQSSFEDNDPSEADDASAVSDARHSSAAGGGGATGGAAGSRLRRASVQPSTWVAYSPYLQGQEVVLEAGGVAVRVGLLGRYGPERDLVSLGRRRVN